jgi:outer membrane protein insertion porin family
LYNAPVGRRIVPPAALVLVLACISSAQPPRTAELGHQLSSIKVKGLRRLSADQVIAASALRPGQSADEAAFKQMLDRLGQTGLFTRLSYRYQCSTAGCDLEIQAEETDKLRSVSFENFVWLADAELVRLAHARLPLFQGLLPISGMLADQLASALKDILAERGVRAEVEYLPLPGSRGSIESYQFKLSGHPVLIDRIEFPGASREQRSELDSAARPLLGKPYLRTKIASAERTRFTEVYQARGYLKVDFSPPQTKIIRDGSETRVDLTISVSPGPRYRVASVSFRGNQVSPTAELAPLIHLRLGQPANAMALREDLAQIEKLYGTKGYIAARIEPSAELDDSQASVRYILNFTEGDLYRMGALKIEGLRDDAAEKISAQWQMKPGDPFDQGYIDRFFKFLYRDIGLGGSWNVVPKQSISQQDKTVSVILHFVPKA